MRGDMPIPLTLPLHFDLRLRTRRQRWRRLVLATLLALGAALLAAGVWLPAKAERPPLSELAIGDELTLEQFE